MKIKKKKRVNYLPKISSCLCHPQSKAGGGTNMKIGWVGWSHGSNKTS